MIRTENNLLNKRQLSHYLGMSMSKIDYLMKEDKIGYYKIGKKVRFKVDEVNVWLEKYRNFTLLKS